MKSHRLSLFRSLLLPWGAIFAIHDLTQAQTPQAAPPASAGASDLEAPMGPPPSSGYDASPGTPGLWNREIRIDSKKKVLEKSDWVKLALNLSGDTDEIARKATEELRKIPKLEVRLRTDVTGPYRGLALDTIVTLEMKALVPDLLSLGFRDEDGFIYQAINSLIDEKNSQQILDHYLGRLKDMKSPRRPSAPAATAMIDTLTRLKIPLPLELERAYLEHESFEVRLMTMRNLVIALEAAAQSSQFQTPYLYLLKTAFQSAPYQLRLSALFAWRGMDSRLKKNAANDLDLCMRDANMELRSECQFAIDRYAQESIGGK